jgi:hypothetical protein
MRTCFFVLLCFVLACGMPGGGAHSEEQGQNSRLVQQEPDEPNHNIYSWLKLTDEKNCLRKRIPVPKGYHRVKTEEGSFGNWLRFVPLKEGNPPVHLYNGELKGYQQGHYAVINMDVGDKDLQQCADAVMRLRAEYLFSKAKFDELHFNYTSGDKVSFGDWCKGRRPVIKGNKVVFTQGASCQPTYEEFRKYMNNIFSYCGTLSLSKEMKRTELKDIRPGDVFIFGGTPGHAVLVMDVALNDSTGDKVFLIAQSYMPAQEMHVLVDPGNSSIDPWYSIGEIGDKLKTPEWTFSRDELKRF